MRRWRGTASRPLVDCDEATGQIALEQEVLKPLRAALERGALVATSDGIGRASPEQFREVHEAERFARLLGASDDDLARAARLARLATALERTLRFGTTGAVNGYEVQRADLVLREGSGTLYGLRDGAGIFRLALFAPGGAIVARRDGGDGSWSDNASLDVTALAATLRRNSFLPSWIDVAPPPAGEAMHVRAAFLTPSPTTRGRATEPGVAGLRASPGRAVGLARLGTRGRRPEDLDGGVLFARTIVPDDHALLRHAAAVVGTGGGILSHAGLMAAQCGRPALIVDGAWREKADGSALLVYRRVEFDEETRAVDGVLVTERCRVREREASIDDGDLVVVDADAGWLRVLGQGHTALAIHASLRSLADARTRLAVASSPDEMLVQRRHRARALHLLEKLLGRVDDPALVRHAVQELLLGAEAGAAERTRADQQRLLKVLVDAPATGALARQAIDDVAGDIDARLAVACDRVRRVVPQATDVFEVLALCAACTRLDALRRQLEAFHEPCGGRVAEPHHRGASSAAIVRTRLTEIHADLVASLRQDATHAFESPECRHRLRQALRLADLLGRDDGGELGSWARALERRDAAVVARVCDRLVLWPDDGGLELEPLVGSKAANLAELARLGAADLVAGWFVVTDRAFRAALDSPAPARPGGPWSTGEAPRTLGEAIDLVLARDDADASQKAALVAGLWDDVRLPAALVDAIAAAYRRLGTSNDDPGRDDDGPPAVLGSRLLGLDRPVAGGASPTAGPTLDDAGLGPYVAIRSSAREEDTEDAVRAGEFDTFLFVRGIEAVVQHLRRAWSGLWTARAIHDRAASRRASLGEGGGVVVQRIVWSRASGVLQTTNVAESRTREMVINVGLGLGEGIVSGLVAADHVVVSKDEDPAVEPLRFHYVTADKRERVVFDARAGRGTTRADVLSHQRLRAALEYGELVELVQIARRLEAAYGYPLDIEFGLEGPRLRLLQVRPVPGSSAVWQTAAARLRGGTS